MAQRRMLARNREMRIPTHRGSGSRGSQSQGALNLIGKIWNHHNLQNLLTKVFQYSREIASSDIGLVPPVRLQHQPRHDPLQCPLGITYSRQVSGGQGLKMKTLGT